MRKQPSRTPRRDRKRVRAEQQGAGHRGRGVGGGASGAGHRGLGWRRPPRTSSSASLRRLLDVGEAVGEFGGRNEVFARVAVTAVETRTKREEGGYGERTAPPSSFHFFRDQCLSFDGYKFEY